MCASCGDQIEDNELLCGECSDSLGDNARGVSHLPLSGSESPLDSRDSVRSVTSGEEGDSTTEGGEGKSSHSSVTRIALRVLVVLALAIVITAIVKSRRGRVASIRSRKRAEAYLSKVGGRVSGEISAAIRSALKSGPLARKRPMDPWRAIT